MMTDADKVAAVKRLREMWIKEIKGNDKMKAIRGMSIEEIVAELERIATLLANRFALCAPVAARGMRVPSGAKALGEQDVCAMVVDDLKITFGIDAAETVNAGE